MGHDLHCGGIVFPEAFQMLLLVAIFIGTRARNIFQTAAMFSLVVLQILLSVAIIIAVVTAKIFNTDLFHYVYIASFSTILCF